MDKDLLRIVIITIGLLVIIGMLLLEAFKNRKRHNINAIHHNKTKEEKIERPFSLSTGDEDIDIVPLGSALDSDPLLDDKPFDKPVQKQVEVNFSPEPEQELKQEPEPEPEKNAPTELELDSKPTHIEQEHIQAPKNVFTIPKIIQIQVLALEYEGFNGQSLTKVFEQANLEYGSNKIFEHLDKNRKVNFSVASMVEPGLFPETEEEQKAYNCPGIVFFLQPDDLDNPVSIFDKFIETISFIANELEGVKLDHNREPLSKDAIQLIRRALIEKYSY